MTPDGLLGELEPDLLYVGVFGPDFGESIVVRIPPDKWLVVDGCRIAGRSPVAEVLKKHRAKCDCILLTHAHDDHADGLLEVLDLAADGALLGCADPILDMPTDVDDDQSRYRTDVVATLLRAIDDRWEAGKCVEWQPRRGDRRQVGEGEVLVLHPDDVAIDRYGGVRGQENRVASPILLQWGDFRLLLGADLAGEGWGEVAGAMTPQELGSHHCLKVPHHCSREALHPSFQTGSESRIWMATPWNRGRKLPRFEDDQGVANLLRHVRELHLTALPVKHSEQEARPFRVSRADLRDRRLPPIAGIPVYNFDIPLLPEYSDTNSCWVVAAFHQDGTLAGIIHGPSSLVVFESAT